MLSKEDFKEAKSIFRALDEIRCAEPREITPELINKVIKRAQEFLILIQCLRYKQLVSKVTDILQKYYSRIDIAYNYLLDEAHLLDINNWITRRRFRNPDNTVKRYTYPFYLAFEIIINPYSYKKNTKDSKFVKLTKEFYWSSHEIERASKFIKDVLQEAKDSIRIQDNFLDESVFNYFNHLDEKIDILLLLRKPDKDFLIKLDDNDRKYLFVKSNIHCHDRFIIIDNKKIWHLGSSINKIGLKASMINLVESKKMIQKIIEDFRTWWDEGKNIYTKLEL